MKKCRIPKENSDLRRYAFFRNLSRLLLFVGWCGMWHLAYTFYLEYPINKPFVWWVMLIFIGLVLISGWIICHMTAFVREKSFYGNIEGMKIYREIKQRHIGSRTTALDEQLYRGLIIRDEKGKKRKLRFKMKDSGFGLYYREGKDIVYFRGTKFPLSLEDDGKGACMCVVCGSRNYAEWRDGILGDRPTTCSLCGHSLIDVQILKR